MFDFDEFRVQSLSVENMDVPTDYRGEDAHERFMLAELKFVQENIRRIEDDTAVEDDDDDHAPDGQFSDTEDENSTNGLSRIRNLIRRRVPPSISLQVRGSNPRRILPPSIRMRPRWSSPY